MATSRKRKRLSDAYRFAGFRPLELVRGVAGNTGVARAFQKLLPTTPVALSGGGLPVEAGIVDGLRRPATQ